MFPTENPIGPPPDDEPEDWPQEPPLHSSGPFVVPPVDPMVFRESADSPELRPAASYVQMGPQLNARTPKPQRPEDRSYPQWTPGGAAAEGSPEPANGKPGWLRAAKKAALVMAVLAPLALIAIAVAIAVRGL